MTVPPGAGGPSDKSRSIALALGIVLGPFGGHRFYVGKTQSAVLMVLTLGGAGLWWLYDVILIGGGSFRDAQGRLVTRWEPEEAGAGALPAEVLDELAALRGEVAELSERVDFAERLLAQPRSTDPAYPTPPA